MEASARQSGGKSRKRSGNRERTIFEGWQKLGLNQSVGKRDNLAQSLNTRGHSSRASDCQYYTRITSHASMTYHPARYALAMCAALLSCAARSRSRWSHYRSRHSHSRDGDDGAAGVALRLADSACRCSQSRASPITVRMPPWPSSAAARPGPPAAGEAAPRSRERADARSGRTRRAAVRREKRADRSLHQRESGRAVS